jgi:hypothetical protein
MRLKTRNKPNQEDTVQSWDGSTTVIAKMSLFQHVTIVQWGKTHEFADHIFLFVLFYRNATIVLLFADHC